jgi:hypothetical protein
VRHELALVSAVLSLGDALSDVELVLDVFHRAVVREGLENVKNQPLGAGHDQLLVTILI